MKTPYSYVLSAQGKWHRITQEINYLTFEVVCGRRFEAGTVTCMSAQQLRARASELASLFVNTVTERTVAMADRELLLRLRSMLQYLSTPGCSTRRRKTLGKQKISIALQILRQNHHRIVSRPLVAKPYNIGW